MSETPLNVTTDEYLKLLKHEAIVTLEGETAGGDRFAEMIFCGTRAECERELEAREMIAVPQGVKVIGKQVVLVQDLLPDKETAQRN